MTWSVVYKKAINEDGSLLFPERLTKEFLENARRTMGSYLFANQYQNEVVPEDEKVFRQQWYRTYSALPKQTHTFAFIDPAIGQKDHHDYTGVVVVDVDPDATWYVRVATRYRLTPTQIVEKMFEIQSEFKCKSIGVEVVAYQEALLYILSEEMKRKQQVLPVTGVTRGAISKQSRILGLVPRFEWGRCFIAPGLTDLEDEFNTFPRCSNDDLLDSLASIENIVFYPTREEKKLEKPNSPQHPDYEKWYIQQLAKR